jgi:protein-S-isoprenylcysteine O-methyltransferase Ste14
MTNRSDPNNLDHADVRIPPPLIYVAGFVLGLLLERAFPVLVLPKTYSRVAAVLCIALWAILTVWSIGLFNRARTSFLPIRPTTTFVVHAPYQFTRNPMYFGLVCLYLGLALWFGMFWALILLPAVIARSALRHRPRRAVPGAKIWRRVSQIQGGRATVDLIGV